MLFNTLHKKTYLTILLPLSFSKRFMWKNMLYTKTILNTKTSKGVIRRTMHVAKQVVKHNLIPKSKSVLNTTIPSSRGYAVRSVNKREKNLTNAQAIKNRPPTPHYEVHRQTCPDPSCKNQDCPTLCGPAKDLDVTGHFTSNPNPALEPEKTAHMASATKLDQLAGSQTFVAYANSHQTPPTPVHTAGTNKLNTDPQFKKIIIDNEDKK
jgi:hypothetical protein